MPRAGAPICEHSAFNLLTSGPRPPEADQTQPIVSKTRECGIVACQTGRSRPNAFPRQTLVPTNDRRNSGDARCSRLRRESSHGLGDGMVDVCARRSSSHSGHAKCRRVSSADNSTSPDCRCQRPGKRWISFIFDHLSYLAGPIVPAWSISIGRRAGISSEGVAAGSG
jgi:hypothetical protein